MSIWSMPTSMVLVSGSGDSFTPLNAFDNALLSAGIANYNHIKLSSILPPKVKLIPFKDAVLPAEGSLLPGVLSECHGTKGDVIFACLTLAFNQNDELPGMIFELHEKNMSPIDLRKKSVEMVEYGMHQRGWEIKNIVTETGWITVSGAFGCVIASAVMLP